MNQVLFGKEISMGKPREKLNRPYADTSEDLMKYKALYDFAPVGYVTWDDGGIILEANHTAAKLLEMEQSLLIGLPFNQFIMPAEQKCFDAHLMELFRRGERQTFELQLIKNDGSSFFAFLSCIHIADGKDRVEKCLALIADISARKQIEEELQQSEKRYRRIVEDQTELICRYRPDGTLTFVNEAYCRFFNRKRDELIGHSFFRLIPRKDQRQVRQVIASLNEQQPRVTHQHRIVLTDGRTGWQEWTNRIIHNRSGVFVEYQAVGRDITDLKMAEEALQKTHDELEALVEKRTAQLRKERQSLLEEIEKHRRTEEDLRASEERFHGIFDYIGVGIALISPEMEILTLNPQMNEWFPHLDTDLKPLCYRSFNDPPRENICSDCPTFKTLQDGQVHEAVADTPRGHEIRHYRIIASPLKDRSGRIFAAIEMVTDITEGVRTRQQLLESDIRYRTVFETTGTAMLIIDEDMTVAFMNREFEKLSGYVKSEVEGRRTWTDFIIPDDIKRMKKYHRLRRKNPEAAPSCYECRARDRTGQNRDIFLNVAMIPGTTMSVVSMMDISERKQAMKALEKREQDLAAESRRLQEMNTALKVLLRQREDDRQEIEKKVLSNVRKLVLPYVEKLSHTPMSPVQTGYLDVIDTNLKNVISPFLRNLTAVQMDFTPREIEAANLVREGKTAKEIAGLLNLSVRSVEFHKDNIRRKLGLSNKKVNLRTHLMALT
jgi:PAS domain S-box-containing protein